MCWASAALIEMWSPSRLSLWVTVWRDGIWGVCHHVNVSWKLWGFTFIFSKLLCSRGHSAIHGSWIVVSLTGPWVPNNGMKSQCLIGGRWATSPSCVKLIFVGRRGCIGLVIGSLNGPSMLAIWWSCIVFIWSCSYVIHASVLVVNVASINPGIVQPNIITCESDVDLDRGRILVGHPLGHDRALSWSCSFGSLPFMCRAHFVTRNMPGSFFVKVRSIGNVWVAISVTWDPPRPYDHQCFEVIE